MTIRATRRRRALTWLLAVGLTLVVGLAPDRAAADDAAVTETSYTIDGTPEADGRPVALDATLMTTDPGRARPAVVLAHGFGGTKADSAESARTLARSGYTVITYTARGFGASGGRIHLNAAEFEGADARRVIDFAATRPEVASSDGDPVIGFAGASYGGAVSLLVAGLDPRVDAIAPAFTYASLSSALFPQYATSGPIRSLAGVDPPPGPGVFKRVWAALFFLGGGTSADSLCGRFTAELCRDYLRTAETGQPAPGLLRALEAGGPGPVLGRIAAPTLLIHGESDTLFPLDQADAIVRGLPAGTPAAVRWVEGGHDTGIDVDAQLGEITAWFDRYLAGNGSPPDTTFSVDVPQTSLVGRNGAGEREPERLTVADYPGRQAPPVTDTVALDGRPQPVLAPPGGTPAAVTNLPGAGAGLGRAAADLGLYSAAVLPGQSAVFTTAALTVPRTLVGSGRVRLRVTSPVPEARLFVSVWDLGPDLETERGTVPQTAVLPQLAVAPVRLTGLPRGEPREVDVALPPVVHSVPVGHRLRLVVSSTDQAYAGASTPAVYAVDLAGSRALVLPRPQTVAITGPRLSVPPALVAGVAGLALLAGIAAVVAALRRRRIHPRPDLARFPLAVEDLAKTYAEGVRAVDGVSFRADAGQVVGLLGPNGAGKTTTIRMLVGLIRPDAGAVYVHGQPVHPGSEVLGSVGALIEGPGFLPHLTGLQNLRAYWAATGRPAAEAHLEEALAVAGLGGAVHRRVRGYSHGMRQRLGIAQAMLGMPSLLLLDEPTNGLDPPQITAMRSVLSAYAATGRTVLISSHLLTEVEQTCSHVVVMHRGRVVLAGPVAELTGTGAATVIGLAPGSDLAGARARLAALGVQAVVDGDRLRVDGPTPRGRLVETLVAAGYAVESVDGRRHLEEVFLRLVGAPAGPPDGLGSHAGDGRSTDHGR